MYKAHIDNKGIIQSCKEHCRNVATISKECAKSTGLGATAYLSGLLHDAGKFTEEFDEYITKATRGEVIRKGSVIHTFAGCSYLLNKYHNRSGIEGLTAEIIGFTISSHHGIFDCIDENGENGFIYRQNKQPIYDTKAIYNLNNECATEEDIDNLFLEATNEISNLGEKLSHIACDNGETMFYVGLLARSVLATVIEGDRRDTRIFMTGNQPHFIKADKKLWQECLNQLSKYTATKPCMTKIQKARQELSDICYAFANNAPDIYRLNLPTGAGKTLSSLRYALHHATQYDKKRIIYVAPLISILEQNADVISSAVGNSELVLEHHSNIIAEEGEEADKRSLLMDNWDAPIIVTTLVQFLNTLFSSKTSSVRRFTALNDSVIILDEVQSVPWKMITLFNLSINYLKIVCNATIILCSATQPTFELTKHKLLVNKKEFLSREQKKYYDEIFKRSIVKYDGEHRLEAIPKYVIDKTNNSKSVLIICNKKSESRYIYKSLSEQIGREKKCFHISASMCQKHRENTLNQIYTSLNAKENVVCVATQVIESGVDISFETVIRIKAGIDNIVQAAGRNNRNGEMEGHTYTYVISCSDENLKHLEGIKVAQDAFNDLEYNFEKNEAEYDNNLASDKSIEFYYTSLYNSLRTRENYCDYPLMNMPSIYEMLSTNDHYVVKNADRNGNNIDTYCMRQAFKTAGEQFEVLDGQTISVIVPYEDEGRSIIAELGSSKAMKDYAYAELLIKKAKKYTVSVMNYEAELFKKQGALRFSLDGTVQVLSEMYYDNATGVSTEEVKICNTLIL